MFLGRTAFSMLIANSAPATEAYRTTDYRHIDASREVDRVAGEGGGVDVTFQV